MTSKRPCACGRDAVDLVYLATDDGLLLVPVCADCAEDPVAGEHEPLAPSEHRRPLSAMPRRDTDARAPLALDDGDQDRGAA